MTLDAASSSKPSAHQSASLAVPSPSCREENIVVQRVSRQPARAVSRAADLLLHGIERGDRRVAVRERTVERTRKTRRRAMGRGIPALTRLRREAIDAVAP